MLSVKLKPIFHNSLMISYWITKENKMTATTSPKNYYIVKGGTSSSTFPVFSFRYWSVYFSPEKSAFLHLCIFVKTNNKAENVFGYSLKQGAPLVNNSPTTDYKQVSTWPFLESLLWPSVLIARSGLRLNTVIQDSIEWFLLAFYEVWIP